MSENAQKISEMLEYLPTRKQWLVMELVKSMLPDDVATDEDIADILEARAEYERGETTSLDDID